MATLTDAQNQAVKDWVAQGAGLSEVQKNLLEKFGISMTYMDVRFLVIDLGAAVKDKKTAPAALVSPQAAPASAGGAGLPDDDLAEEPPGPGGAAGGVRVEVDRITKPGSMVSGRVTFSDGIDAVWMIDQQGRLGLQPSTPGYRPAPMDIQAFQLELRKVLEHSGF
jgi:hypothetical protein